MITDVLPPFLWFTVLSIKRLLCNNWPKNARNSTQRNAVQLQGLTLLSPVYCVFVHFTQNRIAKMTVMLGTLFFHILHLFRLEY